MEPDGRRYPSIDDAGYSLTQEIHQDNHSEVCASPLGYHNHILPGTRRRKLFLPEGCMNDGDDLPPVSGVRVFLLRFCENPHPEVFVPHSGWASGAIYSQPQNCLRNILPPQDIIVHWEGGHLYGNRSPWWRDVGM